MHSAWFSSTFVSFSKFTQIKEGGPNLLGKPILQKGWITWSPLLYFNVKHLKDPNSSSFIRFQFILHDSAVLLSVFENLLKLKRGDLTSWANQFCRTVELLGPSFCISILNISRTQIFCHLLDLNAFYMSEQPFCQFFKI